MKKRNYVVGYEVCDSVFGVGLLLAVDNRAFDSLPEAEATAKRNRALGCIVYSLVPIKRGALK